MLSILVLGFFVGTVGVMTPDEQLRFDEIVSGFSESKATPTVSRFVKLVMFFVVLLGFVFMLVGVETKLVFLGVFGFLVSSFSLAYFVLLVKGKEVKFPFIW